MRSSNHLTASTGTQNVTVAYEYLEVVRAQLLHNREIFEMFLDVLKQFKEHNLERMEVIEHVADLFADHPQLLKGFNQFLPKGYRLEPCNNRTNSKDVVIVTPEGISLHQATQHLRPKC